MEKLAFCNNCCEDVEFEIRNEIVTINLKGMKFSYGALIPYCNVCQKEVNVDEINDLNIIRAFKAQKEYLEKQDN